MNLDEAWNFENEDKETVGKGIVTVLTNVKQDVDASLEELSYVQV